MTLASNTRITLGGTLGSVFDSKTIEAIFKFDVIQALTTGVGLDQADIAWWDTTRNLAATSEDLDLSGNLTDAFGVTVAFAKVKGLFVRNRSTAAGEVLIIGAASANQFALFDAVTDSISLGPDGTFMLWEPSLAGKTVTASTADLLKMDSVAATFNYDICIIGTSS